MAFLRQQWKMKYKQLWLVWLQNLVLSFTDLTRGSDQEQELMGSREASYANDTALPEPQGVGKLIYSGHFRSRLPAGGTCLAASYCPYPFLWLKLPCKAVHAFWIEPSFFHALLLPFSEGSMGLQCQSCMKLHSFIHSFNFLMESLCIRHILWPQLAHGVLWETK